MRHPRDMHVIQVEVTNICDGPKLDGAKCSNCTRLLPYAHPFRMTVDEFRLALRSLRSFPGTVGMFGGNPCMLPDFAEYVQAFREERPDRSTRGIWTNNYNGHRALVLAEFGYVNFNNHKDELYTAKWRKPTPDNYTVPPWTMTPDEPPTDTSYHCPPLVAIRDIIPDHAERNRLIQACPVQNQWSACVTVNTHDGRRLEAFFCEVAAAFSHFNPASRGIPVSEVGPEWWAQPLERFQNQIDAACDNCGMALPFVPRKDTEHTDDVSKSNEHIACWATRAICLATADNYDPEAARAAWHNPLDYGRIRTPKE